MFPSGLSPLVLLQNSSRNSFGNNFKKIVGIFSGILDRIFKEIPAVISSEILLDYVRKSFSMLPGIPFSNPTSNPLEITKKLLFEFLQGFYCHSCRHIHQNPQDIFSRFPMQYLQGIFQSFLKDFTEQLLKIFQIQSQQAFLKIYW